MMFFVQVAQSQGISENLIQGFHALLADSLVEAVWESGKGAVGLDLTAALAKDGGGAVGAMRVLPGRWGTAGRGFNSRHSRQGRNS